jgi:phytoene dehydrogenase-like protein
MSERLGMTDIKQHIIYQKTFTPNDWASEYNLWKGSAFGLSHSFFQSAYFRPQNKSKTLDNVYFAGASTVPGNGIPMVIISGSLAAKRIEEDMS